jgi:hypothetical protein
VPANAGRGHPAGAPSSDEERPWRDQARFAGIVHHTDAAREYAYDRPSKIGQLDKAWDEAKAKGWTVVDMKQDWKKVFAFEP